jgi:hypothetical protein
VEAPSDSQVAIVPRGSVAPVVAPDGVPLRLVDDPSAPAVGFLHPDASHPYRLIDVVRAFNDKTGGNIKINSYDVQCVRQRYDIDKNPTFFYKLKFTSPRYSEAFIDWLLQRVAEELGFFNRIRAECRGRNSAV